MTLEISNTTPLPAKIYANEGIAQVLFFEGDEAPEVSLQGQEGQVPGTGRGDAAEDLTHAGRGLPGPAHGLLLALRDHGREIVAVHPRDEVDADLLGACLLTLAE